MCQKVVVSRTSFLTNMALIEIDVRNFFVVNKFLTTVRNYERLFGGYIILKRLVIVNQVQNQVGDAGHLDAAEGALQVVDVDVETFHQLFPEVNNRKMCENHLVRFSSSIADVTFEPF